MLQTAGTQAFEVTGIQPRIHALKLRNSSTNERNLNHSRHSEHLHTSKAISAINPTPLPYLNSRVPWPRLEVDVPELRLFENWGLGFSKV